MVAAARAAWKGFLKVGSVACAVKLIGATSESDKIHFRILNRKDKLPVRSAYIDEGTEAAVEAADQVKGYEINKGEFVLVEPEELKKLKVQSEHTLDIDGFIPEEELDQRYFEKPYFLVPGDPAAASSFAVLREAMARRGVAARSSVILYQRCRPVVIQPSGKGMILTTLRTHGEVISEKSAFEGLKSIKAEPDMIEIATMLIDKKKTEFDPSAFEDRYENALIEMINALKSGKKPPKPAAAPKENVVNLADILRKSLEKEGISAASKPATKKKAKAA